MANLINQNWVFGYRARLNFSTTPPTASASTAIGTDEGCASISDAGGKLVMYTDGNDVWDSLNSKKATGLQGSKSSTQSAIIVPSPGKPAEYYIFTADGGTGGNNHFNGVRIDSTTWATTQLSSIMAMPSPKDLSSTEKVTAIQHANCRDFWVLTVVVPSNKGAPVWHGPGTLRVFLVSPSGVQHVADTPMKATIADIGYLKGSGDGKRLGVANWDVPSLVYSFDNATGSIMGNPVIIPVPAIPDVPEHPRNVYGIEFSPSNKFLYCSIVGGTAAGPIDRGYVFQYDLAANTSVLAGTHHPNNGKGYALGALQLGMDGKIYVAQDGEAALGIIANPDAPATPSPGFKLAFNALPLPSGAMSAMGLPNLIPNPCGCACEEGNCEAAVRDANEILNARADKKFFTIIAKGQTAKPDCRPAFEQVDFAPHFSLHWGDGPTDQFESHDTEILYIRVRNPYRNLIYRRLKIFRIRITPNQVLPDGENALQLVPAEIVCFDEVGPCAVVSRDFAFLIQNAVVQGYQISFEYCIEETAIVSSGAGRAAFDIKVVAS